MGDPPAAAEPSTVHYLAPCSCKGRRKGRITTPRSSSETSNLIDNLTDGLLVEILHRLPCESAHQCKSVSKRWFSLISDPYFVSRFIHHQHQFGNYSSIRHTLLFQFRRLLPQCNPRARGNIIESTSEHPVFKSRGFCLDFLPCFLPQYPHAICVVASFNDLLVCCDSKFFQNVYYICNPLTMQWVVLPPAPGCHRESKVGIVCDFYCCDKDKDKDKGCTTNAHYRFKLVRIPRLTVFPTRFHVQIFSSETGEWSESVVSSPRSFKYLELPCFSIFGYNGILHWRSENSVVTFDPFKNVQQCRFIDPPANLKPGEPIDVGVCQGRLRICQLTICHPFRYGGVSLNVWELKDYITGIWCLEHMFFLKEMVSEDPGLVKRAKSSRPNVNFTAFHPIDRDLVYLQFHTSVVLCNLRSKTLEVAYETTQNGGNERCTIFLQQDNVYPLVHPSWPTPVPPLPPNA